MVFQCRRLDMDEIWGFIGKKKNTKAWETTAGDVWTFIALDPETKNHPLLFDRPARDALCAPFLTTLPIACVIESRSRQISLFPNPRHTANRHRGSPRRLHPPQRPEPRAPVERPASFGSNAQ